MSPPWIQLVGQKPSFLSLCLSLKSWTDRPVAKQLVVGSAVYHGGPLVQRGRELVASDRIRDRNVHGAGKKDHKASESQKDEVSILQWLLIWFPHPWVCLWEPWVQSFSISSRGWVSVSYNRCPLTGLRVGLCLIYLGISAAQSIGLSSWVAVNKGLLTLTEQTLSHSPPAL